MLTKPASSKGEGASLPLAGVTIADFSWVLAGPRATSWLGAMGARVIKVEGPKRPDQYRAMAIYEPGKEDRLEGSGAFHILNHTKLQCSIDFTKPRGLELARKLVAISDVVVENFAYGVMDRVGLGYEELRRVKPDIIMVSGSAMGKSGPDKHHVAYGTLIHAFSGINAVTGYEGEPGSLGGTYSDPLTGTTMVLAVLAALWRRRRTGQGQRIDLSMVEATMMQLPEQVLEYTVNGRNPVSQANDEGIAAPHDVFPCAGKDAWLAISVRDDAGWQALCRALGQPDWTLDPAFSDQPSRFRNRARLYERVAEWTRQRPALDAARELQAAGVAAGPSYTAAQMDADPHFRQRGLYPEVEHPYSGRKPVVALPYKLEPGGERYWAAPTFGQHTDHVLRDILGLEQAEIASLRAEGIVV